MATTHPQAVESTPRRARSRGRWLWVEARHCCREPDGATPATDASCRPEATAAAATLRTDGFVSPHIATRQDTRTVENIHVPCSHIGFTVNPVSLYVIADRLAQPEHDWQPFARQGVKELVFS